MMPLQRVTTVGGTTFRRRSDGPGVLIDPPAQPLQPSLPAQACHCDRSGLGISRASPGNDGLAELSVADGADGR